MQINKSLLAFGAKQIFLPKRLLHHRGNKTPVL